MVKITAHNIGADYITKSQHHLSQGSGHRPADRRWPILALDRSDQQFQTWPRKLSWVATDKAFGGGSRHACLEDGRSW